MERFPKLDATHILGAVPFSTISMLVIIFSLRYDLWRDMLETNSVYFGISETSFIVLCILGFFGVMLVGALIWKVIEYFRDQTTARVEARAIHDRERAALVAIFNALDGKHWTDKTRWLSDEPINSWKGVHLDPRTHRVNKLILAEKNLTGI